MSNSDAAHRAVRGKGGPAMMTFRDRSDAGRRLAQRLIYLRGPNVIVLGLPRGGVVVAAEVADAVSAPLDVIVVCRLGVRSPTLTRVTSRLGA